MTASRSAEFADSPLQPDDHDVLQSHPTHEQSTPLGFEPIPSTEEEDEDEVHTRQVSSWNELPWWKRPSPYWVIMGSLGSIGQFALLAPKVAMYTDLACRVHRPEYVMNDLHSFASPLTHEFVTVRTVDVPVPHVSASGDETTVSIFLPNSTYTASFDDPQTQSEPDSQQKCASDPVVQAAVARISAVFMTAMGILSCLTSSWWGSLSDRSGRRVVLLVSVFGLLMSDITHIITAWFVDVLPGGYWFPLVGYLIEGLCGSLPAKMAVSHAYIADTTEPSTRSRFFALQLGLMSTGGAVGPLLGGLLIRSTGDIMSVFYFAAILQGLNVIFILCVPESLTSARARGAQLRRSQEKVSEASNGRVVGVLKSFTRFLVPLVVLLPEPSSDADPLKRNRKDWNLFFVAIAYGLVMSATVGSVSYTFQYAAAQFNWTSEETSYFVSIVGATRAISLAIILPLIIKYFKSSPIQLPSRPNEPLGGFTGSSPSRDGGSSSSSAQTMASDQRVVVSHSTAFDLALARISVGLETVAFLGMAVASTGTLFTLASAATSFGSGFHPTAPALALDIYTARHPQSRGEVGKLFGALSVIQALGSQIISPAFYGFVYFNTVAVFPQAILIVSTCTTLLALAFILFVRIPSKPVGDRLAYEHENEEGNEEAEAETPEILIERD